MGGSIGGSGGTAPILGQWSESRLPQETKIPEPGLRDGQQLKTALRPTNPTPEFSSYELLKKHERDRCSYVAPVPVLDTWIETRIELRLATLASDQGQSHESAADE